MVEIEIAVVGIILAFGVGTLVQLKKGGNLDNLNALKKIIKSGNRIFVRPSGAVGGLVVGEEDYFDHEMEMTRRRIIVLGMDGKRREEHKDVYNQKSQSMDDIIPISHEKGIVLTEMRNPDGSIQPILVGPTASELKVTSDDFEAMNIAFKKNKREMVPLQRHNQDLQERLLAETAELESMREESNDTMDGFYSLTKQRDALTVKVAGAEAERDMALEQIDNLKEIHETQQEDMKRELEEKFRRGELIVKSRAADEESKETPKSEAEDESSKKKAEKKKEEDEK